MLRGADLAAVFAAGMFEVLTLEHYIDLLEQCLCVLPPEVVIHRLTGDGAKRDLIAPLWSADKKRVLNAIHAAFARDDLLQGSELYAYITSCLREEKQIIFMEYANSAGEWIRHIQALQEMMLKLNSWSIFRAGSSLP